MEELVSVITPAYNSAKYISDAIESVLFQTYSNWEMIIIDDCSNDNTVEIVESFIEGEPRINLIKLNKNSGAGVARNAGLEMAKGRYIAFLDADDFWKIEKLSKQIEFIKRERLIYTFSFYDLVDEEGYPLNIRVTSPEKLLYKQLFFCNFIGNLTGIYDTKYLGKIPISSARKRQDWMMWLFIAKRLRHSTPFPESLASYRVRDNSISASKISLLKENYAVYRNYHQYNVIRSLGCMVIFLFVQLGVKPFYIKKLK